MRLFNDLMTSVVADDPVARAEALARAEATTVTVGCGCADEPETWAVFDGLEGDRRLTRPTWCRHLASAQARALARGGVGVAEDGSLWAYVGTV